MILPAAAVFVGAVSQRVTGLGFALIAAPLLTLLAGPYQGIVLANALALLVASTVLVSSWRQVDLRQAARLVPTGLVGVLPGVWVARRLPQGPLQMAIGLLVLAGLGAAVLRSGVLRPAGGAGAASSGLAAPGSAFTATAGAASGFMTATAGVGGPALTVYALSSGWEQTAFAATAQISFFTQAALSLGFKGVQDLPGAVACTVLVAAAGTGLAIGHRLAPRIPADLARRAMIVMAAAGALSTTVKGALAW